MNLPNALSVSRALLLPFILFFMFRPNAGIGDHLIAAGIFVAAALTDFLDGYLARKQGLNSDLGVFLDLTADKVLVSALLVALVSLQPRSFVWIAIIIIFREFIVTGLRSYAAARGLVIPARAGGKLKTVVTLVALAGIIAGVEPWAGIATGLMVLAVVLTVVSGAQYCYDGFPVLLARDTKPMAG
ncbi:MAG TPA: CDP-diacylglycerol--glycerol-3-phosphate 3-phosphatidyltransferase [Chloroflexota bacterium]|nr:CDP-diacylglycerol--glycerol-3-phosphate 3-phosphatidyltransferase [Chloroflexota bacterium]